MGIKSIPNIARRIFTYLIQLQSRYSSVAPYLGKSVLDIGCGSGDLIPFLEEGASYIGVDARDDRITRCKPLYPNYIFYCLNFEKDLLPKLITTTHFSSITLLSVIEYFHNPDFVLERLRSLMDDDTRLIIITPTPVGDLVARAFERIWRRHADPIPHLRAYGVDALDSICKSHGLIVKYRSGIGWHRQFHLAIYARASDPAKK